MNTKTSKTLSVTIPNDLYYLLEEYSSKTAQTKSGFIAQSLRTYIDGLRYFSMLSELENALKRLGTTGNDDIETLEQLNKMMTTLSMLNEVRKNEKK